jgi:hypothetical protein
MRQWLPAIGRTVAVVVHAQIAALCRMSMARLQDALAPLATPTALDPRKMHRAWAPHSAGEPRVPDATVRAGLCICCGICVGHGRPDTHKVEHGA